LIRQIRPDGRHSIEPRKESRIVEKNLIIHRVVMNFLTASHASPSVVTSHRYSPPLPAGISRNYHPRMGKVTRKRVLSALSIRGDIFRPSSPETADAAGEFGNWKKNKKRKRERAGQRSAGERLVGESDERKQGEFGKRDGRIILLSGRELARSTIHRVGQARQRASTSDNDKFRETRHCKQQIRDELVRTVLPFAVCRFLAAVKANEGNEGEPKEPKESVMFPFYGRRTASQTKPVSK